MAAAWLAIALATLLPLPGAVLDAPRGCVICGRFGGTDFVLNVALFLPLGAALALARVRARGALLTIVATTLVIETLQATLVAGRNPSLGDLVANSMGGAIGWWLVRRARSWMHPAPRVAATLACAAVIATTAAHALAGWLMAPDLDAGEHLDLRREGALHDPFVGQLRDVTIGGTRVADAAPRPLHRALGTAVAARLAAGALVTFSAVPAGPAWGRAPILEISRGEEGLLTIAQRRDDAQLEPRLQAAKLRLNLPVLRLPRAFAAAPGEPVLIEARVRGHTLELARLVRGMPPARAVAPLSASLAWTALLPSAHAIGTATVVYSAIWLVVLAVPAAYWGARRGLRTAAVASVATVVGQVAALHAVAAPAPRSWELLATAFGAIVGITLGVLASRTHRARATIPHM